MRSFSSHTKQMDDLEDDEDNHSSDEMESETRAFLGTNSEGGISKPERSCRASDPNRLSYFCLVASLILTMITFGMVFDAGKDKTLLQEQSQNSSQQELRDNSSHVASDDAARSPTFEPSQRSKDEQSESPLDPAGDISRSPPTAEPSQRSKDEQTKASPLDEAGDISNDGSALSALRQRQVQNYRDGNGLIINFHITSHGGTTVCQWAKQIGPTPSFACMGDENLPEELVSSSSEQNPWRHNETDMLVKRWRKYYHFISWEHGAKTLVRSVNETDWENPNLVSIIVMRNPMAQLLTSVGVHNVMNGTAEQWWSYANDRKTNNYALRGIVSPQRCCQGPDTSPELLENAKSYLKRFTFIIDLACLDSSLPLLSDLLNVAMPPFKGKYKTHANKHHAGTQTPRQRIGNDTLYTYLIQRNVQSLKLYKWAKERAFFQCEASNEPIVDMDALGDMDVNFLD